MRFAALIFLFCLFTNIVAIMEEDQPDDKDHTEWGCVSSTNDQNIPTTPSKKGPVNVEEEVDVAIVGGGLAGLLMAIGINNHCNDSSNKFRCKIYERAPKLRSISQGMLGTHTNGMFALKHIHPELPALVKKVGCARLKTILTEIDANGKITSSSKEQEISAETRYLVTWHKMQQTLASLLPTTDAVVTSKSLVSYVEDDETDSVLLYFEDGSIVRAKIVLGCDGVFSQVRRQMANENGGREGKNGDDRPIYFGQLNWGSIFPTKNLPIRPTSDIHPDNAVHSITYNGDPRWTCYLSDAGSGYTFFQLRVTDPEKAMALSGSEGRGGLGLPGVKDALIPIAKASNAVSTALECIPESQLFERSIVGRLPAKRWISSGGRVALVGDAAHGMHPNIGQGGNSAFESSLVLVRALAEGKRQGLSLKQSLKSYEKERKPRADLVQKFSNMMGCSQSTGEQLIEMDKRMAMLDWIAKNPTGCEGGEQPPAGIVKAVNSFDPLKQKGVSLI